MSAPIAIIGMDCRLPGGVGSPCQFWELLKNAQDAITEIPKDRWNADHFYDPNAEEPGKTIAKWGGFLDQISLFDPTFFKISPREAKYMDPQQRILLEICWNALEDAGLIPSTLKTKKVGVYIGAFNADYQILTCTSQNYDELGQYSATGNALTLVSNRISHVFDFRGPSMTVDTACSSSLVALHLACQSLHNHESDLAIVGGVNLLLVPSFYISESQGKYLSPDGRCKTFDMRANGYVRGEGAGIVVLKSLDKALQDHNHIYATILGTAVNQDGKTSGISVPNMESQIEAIQTACRQANILPGQLQYVEAHGTGTAVGDVIEASALGTVLKIGRKEDDECLVGSCKTNIGHLESAAGIAGLIKTVLCLQHQQIPAHLHFEIPNPKIPFDSLCFKIPTQLVPWPKHQGPALAGINSFGFGGTNAHAILSQAPFQSCEIKEENKPPAYLLSLSAHHPKALLALARAYRQYLETC